MIVCACKHGECACVGVNICVYMCECSWVTYVYEQGVCSCVHVCGCTSR